MLVGSDGFDRVRYIDKMNRILHFMKNFKMQRGESNVKTELYFELDEDFTIRQVGTMVGSLGVSIDNIEIMMPNDKTQPSLIKLYRRKFSAYSFFNDDSYTNFLFFSKYKDYINLDIGGPSVRESLPEYNLMDEGVYFQQSLFKKPIVLDTLCIFQYFYNSCEFEAFSFWFHKDFEKLYEVLDAKYNIDAKDYCVSL